MNIVQYLFVCLSEELAEVSQEIGKCQRFTPHHKPDCYDTTNIERVQLEMADVYAISQLLSENGIFTGIIIPPELSGAMLARMVEKKARTLHFMGISKEMGVLS
jgi:hypothetical protein